MRQKYKIQLNDTVIFFVPKGQEMLNNAHIIEKQILDVPFVKKILRKKKYSATYVVVDDAPKQVFKQFLSLFKLIKAAGGMVIDEYNNCLFIFRKGRWDLPKGKIEEYERKKKAAEREVEEECGVKVLKIGKRLTKTYHIYEQGKELMVKKTYWYRMSAQHHQVLIPQVAEDITDVTWLNRQQLFHVKQNTYSTIKDVVSYW